VLARISSSLCEHTNAPGALPSPPSSSLSSPTTPTSFRPTKLPEERLNIVRHFATVSQGLGEKETGKDNKFIVSFSLSPVREVFELRVPRLKVCKDKDHAVASSTSLNTSSRNSIASEVSAVSSTSGLSGMGEDENNDAAEKRKLRKEIKAWWEGMADRLDVLVCSETFCFAV
jgi:1-phosphatidylinositol-3-phosphate 5-kinase